jgi:hypothetical protein
VLLLLLAFIAALVAIYYLVPLLRMPAGHDTGISPRWGNQTGSYATFIPEYWSAKMQTALSRSLRFASPLVVNRDYEGEIAQMGDTVHINSIGDPTVSSYSRGDVLTYEDLDTTDQVLSIDTAKSFSFKVDDIDKRQAMGTGITEAMQRAAYKVQLGVDTAVEALFAGAPSGNLVNSGSAVQVDTAAKAYDNVLIPLKVELDEADVPEEGRFVVVPPWFHGRLLRDDRFVRADASGRLDNGVQGNGAVGTAAGFTVAVSNACALITGDDYRISAGVPQAITYAEQIAETEALRLQTTFADAVRGLYLYGMKLVRPEMISTALASQT